MKLDTVTLAALAAHLLRRFKAFVRPKGNAVEMETLARAFDLALLFSGGIPTGIDFLTRWWTTLGMVIYAPEGRAQDLGGSILVLCHELQHVVQFYRDPVGFVRRYLTSFGRAELEAEAERARLEACWLLHGSLPTFASLDTTRHGYALDDSHADLTRNLLEQAGTAVASGLISTDVGLEVLSYLRAHHPDAIVGQVSA